MQDFDEIMISKHEAVRAVTRSVLTALFILIALIATLFAAGIIKGPGDLKMVRVAQAASWMEGGSSEEGTIPRGVFAGDFDLSGMTYQEAYDTVQAYVNGIARTSVTLRVVGNGVLNATAGDMGLKWTNPEIIREATTLGKSGNVIERYKAQKDLQHENKIYEIQLAYDEPTIRKYLILYGCAYDQAPADYTLDRENGQFIINEGQTGLTLDITASADYLMEYLATEWKYQPVTLNMVVKTSYPKGASGELGYVTDILGSFTTSFSSSGPSRSGNVTNGSRLINGYTLYPGDVFSVYDAISPFTEENGYYTAYAFENGQLVDSVGGGICQVSSTLYNAVLLSELEVVRRYNHSMIVTYVEPSFDAAIAESSGKDFQFKNSTEYPIYIESYVTNEKKVVVNIYGHETRDTVNRKISYVNEILETTQPESDTVTLDSTQDFGYISTQSAHIGYEAKLWKIVTENGVETSKTQVNKSSYKMSPRSAVVGTKGAGSEALSALQAAAAAGSIEKAKAAIAAYK